MSARFALLFAGGALASVVVLNLVLKPQAFRTAMIGMGSGFAVGGSLLGLNYLRHNSIKASYGEVTLAGPPRNFQEMSPAIYGHLSQDYEDRGELELGEEHITVQENVFAQIGILDFGGVREMWRKAVLPEVKAHAKKEKLQDSALASTALEGKVVFCDIGSGVGNICLQLLAETSCRKVVGVEVIPSRINAAEKATANAKKLYPTTFRDKDAVWIKDDLVNTAPKLAQLGVNVIFAHSWMFDDDLMTKFTRLVTEIPTIECVVTSRKLNEAILARSNLKLTSCGHFSADWNEQAPFFIYGLK